MIIMGDVTPEIKTQGKLTSKYLTPCRTFGLKRKSTPKSADLRKKVCSENVSPLAQGTSVESPVSRKVNFQRPCLVSFNGQKNCSPVLTKGKSKPGTLQITKDQELEAQLEQQVKRINAKINQVEKLKQDAIYTRKHNLLELKKSTKKWLTSFKEIALTLHSELQARGKVCTLLDILVDHNISPERVGFNVDILEFDKDDTVE